MRFPLSLTTKIASYIIGKKLRGVEKFATVLQLEPLHTCNLTCTGCGRIREYSTSIKDLMPLEDCLAAAEECEAPMVSICGGEPLIYPHIEALVQGLLEQGRIVYICTNAMFMRKKMRDYLMDCGSRIADRELPESTRVALRQKLEENLQALLAEELITPEQVAAIRAARSGAGKPVIAPSPWMYWNVHVDGLERTHDLIVEREGVFRECVLAMRMAKILGYQVATNTTVYKETDAREIEDMLAFLSSLGVDGHTIAPGYEYDAAKKDMVTRLGLQPEDFYLTRKLTVEKFARVEEWAAKFPILGTPVYLEFLAGKRDLACSAWAIPTRNVRGWKGPCYLMTDGHYRTYRELLERTNWDAIGVVDGVARDVRCENCMMHCGYEPTAALGIDAKPGDLWKTIKFNFGARPVGDPGARVDAFNGVTAGNGHASAKSPEPAVR
jgi:MoaA/NifB/PqqE/SkfB family radical SAM enzyme